MLKKPVSCAVASLCLCWTASDDIRRQLGKNCKDRMFCLELQNYICRQLQKNATFYENEAFRADFRFCSELKHIYIQPKVDKPARLRFSICKTEPK